MTNLEKYKAEITAAILADRKCVFIQNCILKNDCNGQCTECADIITEWLKLEVEVNNNDK